MTAEPAETMPEPNRPDMPGVPLFPDVDEPPAREAIVLALKFARLGRHEHTQVSWLGVTGQLPDVLATHYTSRHLGRDWPRWFLIAVRTMLTVSVTGPEPPPLPRAPRTGDGWMRPNWHGPRSFQ